MESIGSQCVNTGGGGGGGGGSQEEAALHLHHARGRLGASARRGGAWRAGAASWALHDIAITNIVWCVAEKRGGWGGVVYCAIDVQ